MQVTHVKMLISAFVQIGTEAYRRDFYEDTQKVIWFRQIFHHVHPNPIKDWEWVIGVEKNTLEVAYTAYFRDNPHNTY